MACTRAVADLFDADAVKDAVIRAQPEVIIEQLTSLYLAGSDFSLEGEITAYHTLANRVPSLEIQKILYSEIVLKSSAQIYLNHSPEPLLVFP